MISGLDHTIVGVRDLEAGRIAWERLGFTSSPRGRHIGWGTANYCLMLEEGYIELLGIVDPDQFNNNLEGFLEDREGLTGFAFADNNPDGTQRVLAQRGLHPSEPRDLARQLELPEGTVLPRFKLVFLPPEETPGVSAFICRHLTPELVRRPEWLQHANGAVALKGLSVVVEDARAIAAGWARTLGAGAVNTTDNVVAVHVGRHTIVFADPDDWSALYPEVDLPAAKPPFIAGMTIRVADLARTIDHLASWQVDHHETRGGVLVPADQATGCVLSFVAS